jgi:hypothetical protein
VGQGVAASNLLDLLMDDKNGWTGIFPELVLFDCHACHKPMGGKKWGPRQGTGLGPGVVRLNDSNLVMFRHVLAAVDPGAAKTVLEQTRALHQATTRDRPSTLAAAKTLRDTVRGELAKVAVFPFGTESMSLILKSIEDDAERGEFRDFSAAEQAAMAAQSVVVAFHNAGKIDDAKNKALQAKVDVVYKAVEKRRQLRHGPLHQRAARAPSRRSVNAPAPKSYERRGLRGVRFFRPHSERTWHMDVPTAAPLAPPEPGKVTPFRRFVECRAGCPIIRQSNYAKSESSTIR